MARDLLSSEESDGESGGEQDRVSNIKVNEAFARRFEHNKKREELRRLQDKLGKPTLKRKRNDASAGSPELSSDESTSETEDEGELATEVVDSQIRATLDAIRSKDPRVYDKTTTFYADGDMTGRPSKTGREKPMHLRDYHREQLLRGAGVGEDEDEPKSYHQEQEEMKNSIIAEINAATVRSTSHSDDGEDLLVAKPKKPSRKADVVLDVENADKDPETFLSNFMISRAWTETTSRDLQPFESDDEEEEQRADEFEEAYNLRFEDPEKSNEKLRSHARDLAAKYSVRREDVNPRQKKREAEKAKKEAEKRQRKDDKARLRKLKIEELEERVRKIKRAAGMDTAHFRPEDWSRLVDDDWDDAQWEQEMQSRFGEDYYAAEDVASADETAPNGHKARKPKFDDDIDINDIVPTFDDGQTADFALSDDENETSQTPRPERRPGGKKDRGKKERQMIEHLVDERLHVDVDAAIPGKVGFRYRETSPKSFGLTARDILFAEDRQLNEYAGLKKLAAFRDPDKKRKDMKHLGKKARLRKWRLDTFGNEDGLPTEELAETLEEQEPAEDGTADRQPRRKKKRRHGKKHQAAVAGSV